MAHPALPLLQLLGRLQPDTAARCGAALGVLAHHLGIRRQVVRQNIRTAFPTWPGCRRRVYGFQASATMGADFIEIWTAGPAMAAKAQCATPRSLRRALGKTPDGAPNGAMVLATPHLGHWDLGPTAIIQAGISSTPMLCFATFQGDPDINGYLNECRERMDVRVVQVNADDKRGPLAGLRTLRDGHGIGLLADQGPRQGYPAWFLGQAVIAHKGAGLLVKRSKKPLVVGCCLRASSNRSVTYVFPLPQPRPDASDEAIVQQAMDAMGRLIAAAPGQYFWHHKRFKRKIDHVGTPDQSYLNKLDMFYQENQLSHAN